MEGLASEGILQYIREFIVLFFLFHLFEIYNILVKLYDLLRHTYSLGRNLFIVFHFKGFCILKLSNNFKVLKFWEWIFLQHMILIVEKSPVFSVILKRAFFMWFFYKGNRVIITLDDEIIETVKAVLLVA